MCSGPGRAKTSRPCPSAAQAMIRLPLRTAASMTSTPKARPLVIRLRWGEVTGDRLGPGRKFRDDQSFVAQTQPEILVPGRIKQVQAGPEHGNARPNLIHSSHMRLSSNPRDKPGFDANPGSADITADGFCRVQPIPRTLPRADHGQTRTGQQDRVTKIVEIQRRVGNLAQGFRIIRIRPQKHVHPPHLSHTGFPCGRLLPLTTPERQNLGRAGRAQAAPLPRISHGTLNSVEKTQNLLPGPGPYSGRVVQGQASLVFP